MNVKNMTNYGKGIGELLTKEKIKIDKEMLIPFIFILYREIGFPGLLRFLFQFRKETQKIKKFDWVKIKQKGMPRKVYESTLAPIAMMKILTGMVGKDKARKIITEIYKQTDESLMKKGFAVNLFLIPVKELEMCVDGFFCFKEYTKAMLKAGVLDKFHEIEIHEDGENALEFNCTYCLAHEAANEYGNPEWCFPWCELDEVVYPKMGKRLGFNYKRSETLPAGGIKCIFRFNRI